MAVNTLDYEQFRSEHNAINTCINNIESELDSANQHLKSATDEASGRWAASDIEDWSRIYADINVKFARLQDLMAASGVSTESTSSTEAAYAGFDSTEV